MYWLPVSVGFIPELIFSLLARTLVTMLTDFTGFVQGRHPLELGAAGLWISRAWSWALLLAGTAVHVAHAGSRFEDLGGDEAHLSAVEQWTFAAVLLGAHALSTMAVLFFSQRSHRKTFSGVETGTGYVKRAKWDGQDDRVRALAITIYHPSMLRTLADEARQWLDANWERWEASPPHWFTGKWKARLPQALLPPRIRRLPKGTRAGSGPQRRRSRLSTLMAEVGEAVGAELGNGEEGGNDHMEDDAGSGISEEEEPPVLDELAGADARPRGVAGSCRVQPEHGRPSASRWGTQVASNEYVLTNKHH